MKKHLRDESGATVVEIIISLAILSLITVFALPFLSNTLTHADSNSVKAVAVQLANSQVAAGRAVFEGTDCDPALAPAPILSDSGMTVEAEIECPETTPGLATYTVTVKQDGEVRTVKVSHIRVGTGTLVPGDEVPTPAPTPTPTPPPVVVTPTPTPTPTPVVTPTPTPTPVVTPTPTTPPVVTPTPTPTPVVTPTTPPASGDLTATIAKKEGWNSTYQWTVTIKNTGTKAVNAGWKISWATPGATGASGYGSACSVSSGVTTCIGEQVIPIGGSLTTEGIVENSTSGSNIPAGTVVTASAVVAPTPAADSLTATIAQKGAGWGSTYQYTITIKNTGSIPVTGGWKISWAAPGATGVNSWSPAGCAVGGSNIICLGDTTIPAGGTIILEGQVDNSGSNIPAGTVVTATPR